MRRRKPSHGDREGRSLTIARGDLDDFLRGAMLLGCGGGGDFRTGELLAASALEDGPVEMVTVPDAVRRNLTTVPLGVVGAAGGVFDERLPSGREYCQVLDAMEQITGAKVGAILPIEAGGLNGPLGVWASATMGLPLVDADLCGRAVPRLDQMTAGFAGRPMTPAVGVDADGRRIDLGVSGTPYGSDRLERAIRAILAAGTGWIAVGFRPLTPQELPDRVVSGTISRCLALGRALGAPQRSPGASRLVSASLGASVLARGRVLGWRRADFRRKNDVGWCAVESPDGLVRIDVQSEILAVAIDGRTVAETPDVLSLLDAGSGQVLDLDSVRTGAHVEVVGIEALYPQSREEFLQRVGPSGFGIEPSVLR
ncbi:DUF917 domain-containing protein [Ornithinimicrobium cavernae]|uniref:DUF917 domain-containing protein n=1 Tax=Ornithinimicrobium cavernae TaxID=2666047 RepID=UPI000D69D2D9|nr:DUF917 domain-containing protein [Ornithinimicrobium cavernae]